MTKKEPRHTWNHRVIRHSAERQDEPDYYAIHEVHYEDDKPVAYTENPVDVGGESLEDLRITLQWMLLCLDRPVLTPEDFKK